MENLVKVYLKAEVVVWVNNQKGIVIDTFAVLPRTTPSLLYPTVTAGLQFAGVAAEIPSSQGE